MKWTEIFTEESWPPGPTFPPGFTPKALRHYEQACKNPVSGLRGCYVPWSSKKSDWVTLWQVNKTHWRQAGNLNLDCHIRYCWGWSGPRTIRTAKIWTAFSRYCWVWSGPRSSGVQTVCSRYCQWWPSGLSSLSTAGDDLDCLLLILLSLISSAKLHTAIPRYWWWRSGLPWDFPTVVDESCLPVKVSPCRSLLAASQNITTSQSGHGVSACLLKAAEGLGSESQWKWWARGSGFFCKNFSPFHQCLPPWTSQISLLFGMPPSPNGFLLSTLAPKWAASTLTCVLNIVSQYHTYMFHIKMPPEHVSVQHSRCRHARRHLMLTPITYGKDYTSEPPV